MHEDALIGADEMTVADYIDREVANGTLVAGDRLPTERVLVQLLDCSRHAVRRQLDALETQGYITREVGRGTFLRRASSSELTPRAPSPRDLIEARLAWEPNLMSLVVVTATAEDFDDIRRALDGGDTARDVEEFRKWDISFHRALAHATHNAVVTAINDMVDVGRREPMWGELDRRTYTHEYCDTYRAEHREIAEAVFDRDTARASTAMRVHLETVRRYLLQELG